MAFNLREEWESDKPTVQCVNMATPWILRNQHFGEHHWCQFEAKENRSLLEMETIVSETQELLMQPPNQDVQVGL